MRFLSALVTAGLLASTTVARAETPDACPTRDVIVALSDAVLAGREDLPRLKARGVGAEAAYLKVRYGGLSSDETAELVHGLRDAGVREALDLAGALDASRGGFDALAGSAADTAQLGTLFSTLRAVLQHGDAEKLLTAVAALPKDRQAPVLQRIVPAVVDWPDEKKAELGETASRHGLVLLAAGLAATRTDPKAWGEFAATVNDPEILKGLTQVWSWAPALMGNPVLPRIPPDETGTKDMRQRLHNVLIAAAKMPELDFIGTYLNQTGDIDGPSKAAEAIMAEFAAGRIRSNGTLDRAWLIAYRALRSVSADPARMDETLALVSFPAGRYQRTANSVFSLRDAIDRLLVVEALTPMLKGGAAPAMPAEITATFQTQWPLWLELAGSLRTTPLAPLSGDTEKAPIIAELLLAAGDTARLADFVLAVEPAEARLAMATDFAMRLDRGCASTMAFPTEAITLSSQPIFQFAP